MKECNGKDEREKGAVASLPRNVWAVTLTSFFMDVSSEMLINLVPFFLANVLGVRTTVIGLVEGIAETTASLLKIFSGWFSDRMGERKWLAVIGYGISAVAKPFLYFATSWLWVLGVRVADRVGKGVRTAPRDALIADSIDERHRGLAFGLHRAGDTAGAMLGVLIAVGVIWFAQRGAGLLTLSTFKLVVLWSILPAILSVLSLALFATDVPCREKRKAPSLSLAGFDGRFRWFLATIVVFTLGNSADAFVLLRAQERGLGLIQVMLMVVTFNAVYTAVSGPAGNLSDRVGRRRIIVVGWVIYAFIYLGFALSRTGWHVWVLYALYGIYYGMVEGTAKAVVADLVPPEKRGTAYGVYNAAVGLAAFPASFIAGLLWQGAGSWGGFGPSAPFFFGAAMALAAVLMLFRVLSGASTP